MEKVEEGKEILTALGLPLAQRTSIAAYTLLALADIGEGDHWCDAKRRSLKIHDMLGVIKQRYRKTYAENTRETVRRQVLHQLEQARVVDRNPKEPGLPTNSPRTHYALSTAALSAIRSYGSPRFGRAVRQFRRKHGALLEVYNAVRTRHLIPVTLPSGDELMLSPGQHNRLQVAVIKEFAPRFAPGATVLYLGDAANKTLHLEKATLGDLSFPATEHDKLPDIVLYLRHLSRLFLIEAVTSHGPVSPKRKHELETLLKSCATARIYVSAFQDLKEFKRHIANVAWETEVWIAEMPDHMIHFNGDKFLEPNE